MKKFIFPALFVGLYIGAFASNYECAVFGGAATVLGAVLSIAFSAALILLPILTKGEKVFSKILLVFAALMCVSAVLGLLKVSGVITADILPIYIVTLLFSFPFSGFSLFINSGTLLYVILIIVPAVSLVLSALALKKPKDPAAA